MAETTTLATWNAMNSFGDERARGALEVVKWMDADVLALQELTTRDQAESEHSLGSQEAMWGLGYVASRIVDYSPLEDERNMHTMSLWSRVNNPGEVRREIFGTRYGLSVEMPNFGAVAAVHLPDDSAEKRKRAAEAITKGNFVAVMGDYNDAYHDDPSGGLLRFTDRFVSRFRVGDYYNDANKLQRLLGKLQRAGSMARGEAMQIFTEAGFIDVDPQQRSTIGKGPAQLQIDHILVRAGVQVEYVATHSRELTEGSGFRRISDHSPVVARLRR